MENEECFVEGKRNLNDWEVREDKILLLALLVLGLMEQKTDPFGASKLEQFFFLDHPTTT